MSTVLTFCVSLKVTRELANHLEDNTGFTDFGKVPSEDRPPTFLIARQPPSQDKPTRRNERVSQPLQIFEGHSTEALAQIQAEHKRGRNWLASSVFAVLDEQSCKDHSIIIFWLLEDLEFDSTGLETKVVGERWVSWRIRFKDSFWLLAQLEHNVPEFYDDVLSKSDRFLDENGVFPVKEADEIIQREIDQEQERIQREEDERELGLQNE